ncbi:MAG: ABC transporter permease [Endomicrobiaceae bacterium]|nr:ABC transporter permease [Endomicrobiaceae bacterium]
MRFTVLKGYFIKEFIQVLRDRKMIAMIFFIPIMQMTMFGLALTSEVKNIELAIMAKPGKITRELTARSIAGGWFKKITNIDVYKESDPVLLIQKHKAEAVLVAPKEGFEYAFERGNKEIQLLVDATNAQRAQQIAVYVKQLLLQTARDKYGKDNFNNVVNIKTRLLFNHYMDTADFMIPALMIMSSFMVLMLVSSMSMTKEIETGTLEKLVVSPSYTYEILLGKIIPYFVIGLLLMAFMLITGIGGFGLSFRGTIWQLFVTAVLFIASALSCATLISTFAKTQQQAMMGSILLILPSILLSGILFPVENIPSSIRWVCYFNPVIYSVTNFRNIILKGGDYLLFWQNCAALLLMCVILSAAAYKHFKSKFS